MKRNALFDAMAISCGVAHIKREFIKAGVKITDTSRITCRSLKKTDEDGAAQCLKGGR